MNGIYSGTLVHKMHFGVTTKIHDTHLSNNSIVLHGDGSNGGTTFLDSSFNRFAPTSTTGATTSTTQSKFGSTSISFSGSNAGIIYGANGIFNMHALDFTIEAWCYFIDTSVNIRELYGQSTGGISFNRNASNVINLSQANVGVLATGTTTITANVWHHLALSRAGTALKLWLDGNQEASVTNSTNFDNNTDNGPTGIGNALSGASFSMNGFIDDFRVTKGFARYTAAFTPPSRPHPDC